MSFLGKYINMGLCKNKKETMKKEVYIRKSSICQVICIPTREETVGCGFLGLKKKKIKHKAKIFIYYSDKIDDPYYYTFETDEEMESMKDKIMDSLENKSGDKLFAIISTTK